MALRAKEGAKEFATGAGIVSESRPVAVESVQLSPGSGVVRDPFEETDGYIPVANLSHEAGQATDAPVQGPQGSAVGGAEQLLPDAEAGPQPTHLAMQAMEALRGRMGVLDHAVDPSRDRTEDPVELPNEPFGRGCLARAPRIHERSPNARNPARL